MEINIYAQLFVPQMQIYYGGDNPAILLKEGKFNLEIKTPHDLDYLRQGYVLIDGVFCSFIKYDVQKNQAILRGHMKSTEPKELKFFIEKNWIPDDEAFKFYGLSAA